MLKKKYQEQDWNNSCYETSYKSKREIVRSSLIEIFDNIQEHLKREPKDKRLKSWKRWSQRLKDLNRDYYYLLGVRDFRKL
jgi:hypothetical protein